MTDEVITALQNQMTLVEYMDIEYHIVFELLWTDQTSLGYPILAEIIDADLTDRIPNDEETTLDYCTCTRVDFLWTAGEIVYQDLVCDFAGFLA